MLRDTRDAAGLAGQMLTASFVSPYSALPNKGVEGEGGGEGREMQMPSAAARTGSASAFTLTCLSGRERLIIPYGTEPPTQMPAWKSSQLMVRDCYHSNAMSNCSVYFLPPRRKFTRPKIVGPRISKEERLGERGEAYLFIHALKNTNSDLLVDKHRCLD